MTSHEVSIGNENLTKQQVKALYRFAAAYRLAKRAADQMCAWLAAATFRCGSIWLQRTIPNTG